MLNWIKTAIITCNYSTKFFIEMKLKIIKFLQSEITIMPKIIIIFNVARDRTYIFIKIYLRIVGRKVRCLVILFMAINNKI